MKSFLEATKLIVLVLASAMAMIGGTICCWQAGSPVVGIACLIAGALHIPAIVEGVKGYNSTDGDE